MPITPTSTKSKQYQALGIDEIANDIETAFTAINALGGYTETIVNISSAQILSMGSSPVQLLPAAGAGNYYDWYVELEFTANSTPYTYSESYISVLGNNSVFFSECLTGGADAQYILKPSLELNDSVEGINYTLGLALNQALLLKGYNSTNPTLGDGTMRVKVYHKTITFGA